MALISCNNVSMGYEDGIVLRDVNFKVNPGDYLCIVGSNGSGKSTLVKGLLGLVKPKGGEVKYGDSLKPYEIGYLPQQTQVQKDFPATVSEVVISGCLNKKGLRPFYSMKERRTASDNMAKLDIQNLKNKCFRDLSGGQQQRVLLARALCATEKILLLDEPVTGLDPVATADFYDVIKKLNSENNVTIIMVSHDINTALKNANKILHIDKGVLFYGGVDEYLKSDISNRFVEGQNND